MSDLGGSPGGPPGEPLRYSMHPNSGKELVDPVAFAYITARTATQACAGHSANMDA